MTPPTRAELEEAACWEADDQVPGRPAMTAFRRAARYHQARWRQANQHPIGTQPMVPKPGDTRARPVGSRLPLDYARETGANFLTLAALDAARARMEYVEARQSVDHQRLWADLLSSVALSFNLFGDLAADIALADRVVHGWFPDAPGRVGDVRFVHSPGWFDHAYINSLRSFDTVFTLDLDDGSRGVVAVSVKYHERNKAAIPRPENLARYGEVAERSHVFAPGAIDTLKGRGDLCEMWIEHLLLFSMLQHPADRWTWGRYVVVHPAGNCDVADAMRSLPQHADGRGQLRDDDPRTTPRLSKYSPGQRSPRCGTATCWSNTRPAELRSSRVPQQHEIHCHRRHRNGPIRTISRPALGGDHGATPLPAGTQVSNVPWAGTVGTCVGIRPNAQDGAGSLRPTSSNTEKRAGQSEPVDRQDTTCVSSAV